MLRTIAEPSAVMKHCNLHLVQGILRTAPTLAYLRLELALYPQLISTTDIGPGHRLDGDVRVDSFGRPCDVDGVAKERQVRTERVTDRSVELAIWSCNELIAKDIRGQQDVFAALGIGKPRIKARPLIKNGRIEGPLRDPFEGYIFSRIGPFGEVGVAVNKGRIQDVS